MGVMLRSRGMQVSIHNLREERLGGENDHESFLCEYGSI